MTDPFDALSTSETPFADGELQAPRAAFVARLRAQLTEELTTKGLLMTETTSPNTATSSDEDGYLFYFTLPARDHERAGRFYGELFQWDMQPGGSGGYHINGVYPPMGLSTSVGTMPQVWIEVSDIDAAVARVRELGGTAEEPVVDTSGTNAACIDDQGVHFNLVVPIPEYRQGQRQSSQAGELFYWTLPAPDPERAKAFYSGVFGWTYSDPGSQGGMHVTNKLPDGGLGGGREGTHPELFFRVDDLDAAMAKVAELGGTAEFAGEGPEGRHAMCVDDQGTAFGLSEPAVA